MSQGAQGVKMSQSHTIHAHSVHALAQAAKKAARSVASASAEQRNAALEAVAQAIANSGSAILEANAEDMQDAQAAQFPMTVGVWAIFVLLFVKLK